ncbi:KilA-N domain-containing protein [Parazoarcus communis]|uniref:KilA-N domain-containing protein n=1 Tax=Parazoarcus communis TaxID=41977 RepID=UPI00131F21E2|nr:KilA-N domain-containing protein [Parazoarcus communis]
MTSQLNTPNSGEFVEVSDGGISPTISNLGAGKHTKDYNGTPFVFREDGYFNMTAAAKAFGKRVDNFLANVETAEYIDALHKLIPDIPVITSKKGYHTHPTVGTWAHPKLAVFFARWLDVKFAVWCDMMIDDILTKKAEVTITKPEQSAVLAVGLPDTLVALQQTMMANQQMMQALVEQFAEKEWVCVRRGSGLHPTTGTHRKSGD